jgi:hypothetical protein
LAGFNSYIIDMFQPLSLNSSLIIALSKVFNNIAQSCLMDSSR